MKLLRGKSEVKRVKKGGESERMLRRDGECEEEEEVADFSPASAGGSMVTCFRASFVEVKM